MADLRTHSSTSNIVRFTLKHATTGVGLTGLSSASSGLIISTIADNEATATTYTVAGSTIETITTLGTFAAPTATKCRFKEVDATNHKGLYEFQFADARFSVASAKRLIISVTGATNLLDADYEIQLVSFDMYSSMATLVDLIFDEALTGATHNVANSLGRRIRNLQEFGGYEGGFVYVDTVNGSAGTTSYESGTIFNEVNTIADANTIRTALNLIGFYIHNGSTITLAATQSGHIFTGENWTLALGGRDITNSHFYGANVSGIATGTGAEFHHVVVGNTTITPASFHNSRIDGTITVSSTGTYILDKCYGNGTAIIDFAAIGATTVHITGYSGSIELQNMATGDVVNLRGHGKVTINANCTAGTLKWDGHFTVVDNAGGAVTITGDDLSGNAVLIKAKTDSLTFTVAGQVDSNLQYINDVVITGNGSTVPLDM